MTATDRAAVLAASWDPSIIWAGAYLAGALLVGALLMELFRRYLRSERKDRLTASDQLAQFRSLYEQGAISEEEFNSLRGVLGGELRRGVRKHSPAAGTTPTAPARDGNDTPPPPNRLTPPPENGIRPA